MKLKRNWKTLECRKRSVFAGGLLIALTAHSIGMANPVGPTVVKGNVSFHEHGNKLKVKTGDKAIIDWRGFSIDLDETTTFVQPDRDSVVLNRVTGSNTSYILGKLTANGKVLLVNPYGVLFGKNASVDTASFIASTQDICNEMFWKQEDLYFSGDSEAQIVNMGTINAWDGDAILIAYQVRNDGKVHAPLGMAGAAAGKRVLIKPPGDDQRIYIMPSEGENSPAAFGVKNSGKIEALYAEIRSEGNVYAKAINHKGSIDAIGVSCEGGRVQLVAQDGSTYVSGTIRAEIAHKKGGEISLFAQEVHIKDGAQIDASGFEGGGGVYVGGFADRTTFARDAVIKANAVHEGDGGAVVLRARQELNARGKIFATGGSGGGHGGRVKVSGEQSWMFNGHVDTTAPEGVSGYLTLEPTHLTISDAPASPWHLSINNLTRNLARTHVNITTHAEEVGVGDITVEDPLLYHSKHGLCLLADRDIRFNAPFANEGRGAIIANAAGNIDLNADSIYASRNTLRLTSGRDINIGYRLYNEGRGSIEIDAGNDLNIGSPMGLHPAQLASRLNDIEIAVNGDLNVQGGLAPGAYAQLGCDDAVVNSSIHFNSLKSNILVAGGSGDGAFALIGHGGLNAVGGTKSGTIVAFADIEGDVIVQGGSTENAFAQIGHTRGKMGGVEACGDFSFEYVGGDVGVISGTASGSYAMIGHGGGDSSTADSYTGNINIGADSIFVDGSRYYDAFASLGHFAINSAESPVAITAELIQLSALNGIDLHGSEGADLYLGAHVVGAGGGEVAIESMNIETVSGNFSVVLDSPLAVENSASIGVHVDEGTAHTNLTMRIGQDIFLLGGTGGGFDSGFLDSSITISNGITEGPFDSTLIANRSIYGAAGNGALTIESVDALTITAASGNLNWTASDTGEALMSALNGVNATVGGNIAVAGSEGGEFARIETLNGNLTLQAFGSADFEFNSTLLNLGGSGGDIDVSAFGGDLTFLGAPHSPASVENNGSGNVDFASSQSIHILSVINNPGTGTIFVAADEDLNIGSSINSNPAQLGTENGEIILSCGGNLNVLGGNEEGAFAQIGTEASSIIAPITISNVGGNLSVLGGTAYGAYALIGHRSPNPISGTIDIDHLEGRLIVISGSAPDTFAQIGNDEGF